MSVFHTRHRQMLARATAGLAVVVSLTTPSLVRAADSDACFDYLSARNYPRAQAEAQTLLKRKGLSREEERFAQLCLGLTLNSIGLRREAVPSFLRIEVLSRSSEELAIPYEMLGSTYLQLDDLDHAELYAQRLINASKDIGNKSKEATGLNTLAMIVQRRGDVDRAMTLFRTSLALAPDQTQQAMVLANIAIIYHDRKENAEAVKLMRSANEVSRRQGNAYALAIQQINLSTFLIDMKDLPNAEVELTAGLKAIQLIGDKYWEAQAYRNFAGLKILRSANSEAKAFYRKAELIYREIGETVNAEKMASAAAELSKGESK